MIMRRTTFVVLDFSIRIGGRVVVGRLSALSPSSVLGVSTVLCGRLHSLIITHTANVYINGTESGH
jgi:hypothetical protein